MRRSMIALTVFVVVILGLVARNQYKVWRGRQAAAATTALMKPSREALLAELQTVTLSNCVLKRVGSANDGGYVMCGNLMAGTEAAYSYGIGGNDDWGCDVSVSQKVPVHQYDCFEPSKLRCKGGVFKLNAECVGPRQELVDGRPFDTMTNQISRNGDAGRRKIVKMDIEGAEWQTILATPDEVLASITQMPMELHGVDEPGVLEGLRKLKKHFYLLSVHYNNHSCSDRFAPLPSWSYEVLLVNKNIGIPGPPPPGSPALASLLTPDNPRVEECRQVTSPVR